MFCSKLGVCGGCPWGVRPLIEQREMKLAEVRDLFPSVRFVETLPSLRLRDRADLIWEDGRLGLYGLASREIVDLEECPMMSEALESFFKKFRDLKPPIQKGSVRLRVSPQGERGVWLDFANQDVKHLFEEKNYLRALNEIAFVEIGQRRKALYWEGERPRLGDPELKAWFESYGPGGVSIPLYGPVGGFSQGGFLSNRALVEEVTAAAALAGVNDWLELFSGNGNLAVALAARGHSVEALEMDELALKGLEKTLTEHPSFRMRIQRLDVYLKTGSLPELKGRGLVVDPPRAGLRQVLEWLNRGERPRTLIYVSCFTDTFRADAARLAELGYRLESLVGVDQFVHSPHSEWVARFGFDPDR